ncbi:tail protein [Staphylococcus phage Twort]|uniref:Tail protein n=2 Tax=Staphylococcus phage Twort (strain DSM 17442 / HER 48) TaxID=2908167 RepID=A0A6H0X549_BPTWO|nr:ORF001 [Staphylococcus phage Twort]AAX92297.1 ORF001 [Staphylococcus phage Twort]QIW89051.1 tail protein [Staphylococcus phage Twort]
MEKELLLYNKNNEIIDRTSVSTNLGEVVARNLAPGSKYDTGEFKVSWLIKGVETTKVNVPSFTTDKQQFEQVFIVQFSDINDDNLDSLKGDSAYKIWLDQGNKGTIDEFLNSLKGDKGEKGEPGINIIDGASAYDVWLGQGNEGTKEDFLNSLKGEDGLDGKDGESITVLSSEVQEDNVKVSFSDGSVTLIPNGKQGADGLSAYQLAVKSGFEGTYNEWLESLKGANGLSSYQLAVKQGFTGTLQDYLDSGKVPQVLSKNFPKLTNDTSDVQILTRAINATEEGNTLYISAQESPIYLDSTLIINKNINLVSDAKIVYRGNRDRTAVKIDSISFSSIKIKGIYDNGSYPGWGGGYHGFENSDYVGIEFVNCKNVTTHISEIIGFTTGSKHRATEGKGHWFNNTTIEFFINNETSIELNSDGDDGKGQPSWMNSNHFYKSAFSYSGTAFNTHPETYYNIRQTLTNGNMYGGNSNIFDSFKFETAHGMSDNYIMIYLKKAVGFIFKGYRYELNNNATFAVMDLSTQDLSKYYITHSKDNKFIPDFILGLKHEITYVNNETAKLHRSGIAKIITDTNKKYTLYRNNDFSKEYRRLGSNYHTVKDIFRKPLKSTVLNDEMYYDYSTSTSLIDSNGLLTFTGSCPMVLYVNNVSEGDEITVSKLSFVGNSSGIFIKCFDYNGNYLGKQSNGKDTLMIDGIYYDTNNAWSFNTAQKDTFTVNSSDVKTVVVLISGTLQGLLLETTNPNNIVKTSNVPERNSKSVFYSHFKPTLTTDFKYGERVYNSNNTSVVGWELIGNSWQEIGTTNSTTSVVTTSSKNILNIENYPRQSNEDNDYPRFQRALDELVSKGGGTLIVPKTSTEYLFKTSSPTVQNPSRVKITGSNIHIKGEGNPTIKMTGINKAYIDSIDDVSSSGRDVFTGFSFVGCDNVLVEGLSFVGEWDGVGDFRYASPRSIAIAFKGSTNCKVYNVHGKNILGNVVNAVSTMQAVDGFYRWSEQIEIDNCSAYQCLENGFNYMGGTRNGYYTNNISQNNGSSGFESGTENVIISNNIHIGNKFSGISISGTNYTISNNVVSNNTNKGELSTKPANGITITGGSKGVISNNNISGSEGYEILIYPGVNQIDIQNNTIKQTTDTLKNVVVYYSGTSSKPIYDINLKGNTIRSYSNKAERIVFCNYLNDSNISRNHIKSDYGTDSLNIQGSCSGISITDNNMNKNLSVSINATDSYSKDNIAYNIPKVVDGTKIPTSGSWRIGDIINNTSRVLTKGSPNKWKCTSEGIACDTKWITGTSYTQGQIVYNGSYVYKATTTGVSGNTQPVHSSGVVSDGTVSWEFLSSKASFEAISQIGVTESISSTPLYKGQLAIVDSTVYIAKGTSSTSDWIPLN